MDWADTIARRCLSEGTGDAETAQRMAEALREERDACVRAVEAIKLRAEQSASLYKPGTTDHTRALEKAEVAAEIVEAIRIR